MRVDGIVMPALVAGIHVFNRRKNKDVDGRNKSGHDERVLPSKHIMLQVGRAIDAASAAGSRWRLLMRSS